MTVFSSSPSSPTRLTRSGCARISCCRALARRGHTLTLATLWENEAEQADLQELAGLGIRVLAFPLTRTRKLWNLAAALPTGAPLQARFCWQPELARAIRMAVATTPFAAVHIEHLRGAVYAAALPDGRGSEAAVVALPDGISLPRTFVRAKAVIGWQVRAGGGLC